MAHCSNSISTCAMANLDFFRPFSWAIKFEQASSKSCVWRFWALSPIRLVWCCDSSSHKSFRKHIVRFLSFLDQLFVICYLHAKESFKGEKTDTTFEHNTVKSICWYRLSAVRRRSGQDIRFSRRCNGFTKESEVCKWLFSILAVPSTYWYLFLLSRASGMIP